MSVLHAVSGIFKAIKTEENLRFHIVIANLIFIFAYFYGLDRAEWAILIITAFLMISLELVNTAVERTVDTATSEILPTAKFAKDASAGAVLVMAIASLMVGVCLFGNPARIGDALAQVFFSARNLIVCLIIGILDILFLFFCREKANY